MKWLLLGIAGLVALIATMTLIGSFLPRSHTASRTLRLRRSPPEVWPVVTQMASGSSVEVDVVESSPPHRLVTRVKPTERHFGGTWTIAIASVADGSTLTITEDGWVANPIFRFISRLVIGHHATMDRLLKRVATALNEMPTLSGE